MSVLKKYWNKRGKKKVSYWGSYYLSNKDFWVGFFWGTFLGGTLIGIIARILGFLVGV